MFQRAHDEGFSLVEVLIAMFLLAILSLAVLPLLISGVQLSVTNRDVVAATALANDVVTDLRDDFPTAIGSARTCVALTTAVDAIGADPSLTDPYIVAGEVSGDSAAEPACPIASDAYPRAVLVTITVSDSDGELATVPTRITVGAAS